MFESEVVAKFHRIYEVNRITDAEFFSIETYPKPIGIYARNRKVQLKQYFCWGNYPETGAIFLIY